MIIIIIIIIFLLISSSSHLLSCSTFEIRFYSNFDKFNEKKKNFKSTHMKVWMDGWVHCDLCTFQEYFSQIKRVA